jgi:4-amino-4-deoxy-L-arabinose transferase-like glycosyltransferase
VGYALFIWVALSLIAIWAVTPDMLMAALVLLAAGLVVRIRRGRDGWPSFLLLGFVLGLSYLAKTIMFPLGLVFLAVAWLASGELRRAAPRTLAGLLVFLAICLPFILAISHSYGSFTIGEAGTITYLRHVNGQTNPHWQAASNDAESQTTPSRQLLLYPPVYEFAGPIGGTYPVSYNPAHWYAGADVKFDAGRQLQAMLRNALTYVELFGWQQGGLLAITGLLYALGPSRFGSPLALLRRWGLVAAALTAFLLYALVYVEGRYVGVFLLLFWADLLGNVRLTGSPSSPKIVRAASVLMVAFLLANVVTFNLEGYARLSAADGQTQPEQALGAQPVEVAEALWEMGVAPGSTVGVIGYAYDSFWARLARVRIVAELVDWEGNPFWSAGAALQQEVLQAFDRSGACAVVAEYAPARANLPGWVQVGTSSYYVYRLPENC